jgi:hypothetical protein
MLFVERDQEGVIVAIRRGEQDCGLEPVSWLDAEVLSFLRSTGEIESLSQLLMHSDASIVRVIEDLVDLLIRKKVILFTELPAEAQAKLQSRKQLRARLSDDQLMVSDIL